jgi:hypothetical protein
MNAEQKYTIDRAEGQVRQIRRTIEELTSFGWNVKETTRALQAFDVYRGRLALNQTNIETCSPLDKDYKTKIQSLLSEENLLVESISKLAVEARQALTDEELSFFQAREGLLDKLTKQIEEADNQVQQGLTWLIDGLQTRWGLMVKRQELAQRFQAIGQAHNTPESFQAGAIQLPKPFMKMNHPIWSAFVASFLGRVSAVLPSMETASPVDAVRTIYEKPVYVDIGHDPNSTRLKAR